MEEYLSYEPIDIVYTWVNGSDPIWLSKKNEYLYRNDPVARNATVSTGNSANNTAALNETSLNKENADSNRYRDSNELKYSLRSIEKNAPWVRHVYIVTDNQVPHWLNLENDRLTVVSHSEIFQNKSHLPVFSSPAIESHLHEIPGISKKFIYFNDDVFLGTTVTPEDFVSVSGVQKFIMSWDVPKCAPGCAESWIGDGYCDKACNVSECNFDFPDCVGGGKRNHGTSSGSRSASNPVQCSQGCPDSWLADKVCDNKCKTLECGFDMGDCGISLIKENYPGVVLQPHVPTSIASYSTLYDSEVHALSSSGAVYVHAHVANSTNTYLIFPHEASTYMNETDVVLRAPTEIYVPRIVGAEEDLSYTNITNASAANSTTVKTSPTNLVSPVVLRVPYGSANVVYFNLSLLACVSHLMHLDPLGEPPYQSGSGGDAPNGNYSESEWDVRFGVLGGYYPNINGTGSSNGDELTDTVIPSSIDDDATTDGDSAADANSYYPFQELDYQYVESMCNLTQIRGNIASGGDEFVYTHAEYDVDGVVHFASILSQHHTLAVILYHGEYPSNSNDPRTVDPPSSYPYDTTITVSGYNKRNNVNVSTSFKLRVEEPIDMEVPMKSKWYSKHEKWYFRMPMPLNSRSLSGSESLQNAPSGSSSDSVPMKPIHGFSSACFESDPLKLKESSKIRVTDTVSLLKKPFVYRGAASTSTHSKNVEGIVLALDMWSADTFRTRLNEVLDRNDNAEAEIGLTHQLQGIEEIMDKTAISEVLVEYTVTSGDGNHSSFSMPLLELLGFINKRGIVMPLPRGSAPRTLSDAVAKTKELHSHYSSTRKWHGTTPHSDPLTKPEVMALTSKLLSSPDSDTETTTHNVLLLVLPMPVPSEGTPLDSWFHIKWDIVVPPSYDAHRNFQMNGTQAVTTAKQNSTEMSISEHARSCGCGVVSFQWGSLVLPPDVEGSGVSGDAASVEISSNHTDAHAHSIIIADTSTAEVDVDGVVGKQNTSVFSQDIALEASSTSLNSSIGTIEEAAEDCVGGSIRRRLQSAASNLRGVSKASPVEMSTTATRSKVSWIAHIVPEYLASNTAPYAPTETTTQPVDIMALMEKYVYMHGREEDSSVEDIQIMEDPGFSSAYRMLPQNQRRRRLVDTYAQSLVHVNRLYSKAFGTENRKVPAHVPHMIDTDIMREMQDKWRVEWNATSSHRFRSSTDMQFSFSYYYYTMNRQKLANADVMSYLSHQVDTNKNNIVDDNEFRSLVAILKGGKVPVKDADIEYFKANCSLNSGRADSEDADGESSVKDEHGVLRVGPIERVLYPTLQQLASCPAVIHGIKEYASWYSPNPTYVFGSEKDVAFEMIGDNATDTLSQLDSVRARQSKFICINDNIQHLSDELVKIVMEFFEAMFPIPSQFELLHGQRNPTLYTDEYRRIRSKKILGVSSIDAQRAVHKASLWGRAIRRWWTKTIQSIALNVLSLTFSGENESGSSTPTGSTRNVYVHYSERGRRNHRRLFEMSHSSPGVGREEEVEIKFTGEFAVAAVATVLVIIVALVLTCGLKKYLTKQKVKKLVQLHSEEGSTFKVMKNKKTEDDSEEGIEGASPNSDVKEVRGRRGSFYDDKMTVSLSDFHKSSPPPHGDPLNDFWRNQNQATTADIGNGDPLNDIWAKAGYGTTAAPETNIIYESTRSYVNTSTNKSILISSPNSTYPGNKHLNVKFDLNANTIDGEPVKHGFLAFAANALRARRNSNANMKNA